MEGHLRDNLLQGEPAVAEPGKRDAAVAIILALDDNEVLLIQRAEAPGDPWSGQMALPGGRRETDDINLIETAIRETQEEVGLPLAASDCLGHLPRLQAHSRAGATNLWVTPVVFVMPQRAAHLTPNREVADTLWIRLDELSALENQGEFEWKREGTRVRLPAWHIRGRTVWGLTYRILGEFLSPEHAMSNKRSET